VERALRAKDEFVAKLQASNEERDRLLGIVGHDLRNPLTAITTSAALLARRGGLTEEQAAAVGRIQRISERMADMIRGLLDRERIRNAGGVVIEPRPIAISEVVRLAVEEAQLAHPTIRFDLHCGVSGNAHWDPTRLAQLLSNLLGNAAQHGSRASSIVLSVEPVSDEKIAINVSNSLEAAIPPERLARLFEPFERGNKSHGLGLGLHIVSEIAKAHGGGVSATSDGRSIAFRVELPRGIDAARTKQCGIGCDIVKGG
jgi:signal transduction histidine kinase